MSCSVIDTFICFGSLNEERGGGSATADTYLKYESPPKYRAVKNNPGKTPLGPTNLKI